MMLFTNVCTLLCEQNNIKGTHKEVGFVIGKINLILSDLAREMINVKLQQDSIINNHKQLQLQNKPVAVTICSKMYHDI